MAKKPTEESQPPAAEMTDAEKEVADLKPSATPAGIPEAEIAAKVAVGLTRDQAIEVIKSQRAHDKLLAMKG